MTLKLCCITTINRQQCCHQYYYWKRRFRSIIKIVIESIINISIVQIWQHQGNWTGAVCIDHCPLLLCHSSAQAQTGKYKKNIQNIKYIAKIAQIVHPKYHCSLLLCHPSAQAQTGKRVYNQIQNTKNIKDIKYIAQILTYIAKIVHPLFSSSVSHVDTSSNW